MKNPILSRILRFTLIGAFLVVVGWGGARLLRSLKNPRDQDYEAKVLVWKVEQSDFEAFVTEPGDLASSSNEDIRCQVESRGTPGTAILWICDEGKNVEIDEPLVEFDDSVLQREYTAQEIVVANDEALWIQAKSEHKKAERTLREYKEGLFEQETNTLEGEIFVAEEDLKRSQATLVHGLKLASQGFITDLQLQGEAFAVEKAKRDVETAKLKLDVYKRFTYEKTTGEYESDIEKHQARVKAASKTHELSQKRLQEIKEQIESCKVKAPTPGQVVYANDERKGVVIEEGSLIRDNQIVIRLPDISQMEVHVRVNESHVNRVRPDQRATIELDADRKRVLTGKVKDVAPYPYPLRWHGAPLEYGTVITIDNPPKSLRPGLRAKVKIFFEQKENVLQVPLAALIEHEERYFCLVQIKDGWRTQEVEIGPNNNNEVVIEQGLEPGEHVCLTPFRFIKRSQLPGSSTAKTAVKKRSQQQPSSKVNKGTISVDTPGKRPPAS